MGTVPKFPSLQEVRLSCGTVIVDADEALDQAHAILTLLANAFQVDQEADRLLGMVQMAGQLPNGRTSCFSELSGDLFHDALSGVSTLIAAYKHVREESRARFSGEA